MNTESARKAIKIIKKSEIEKNISMLEAIDSMEFAFSKLSSGECFIPKRYVTTTKDESLTFLLKPAFVNNQSNSSIKILTQKNLNVIPGIPTILGIVLLIDNLTGEILSIMDGESITALRTGAASGLATKYLSRKDSRKLAIFGCGSQGRTQLKAVNAVRDINKIWVFDNSKERAEAFIKEINLKIKVDIEFTNDLNVLKDVDIICTATNSKKPLFSKNQLKKGTHINAIGSFKPDMQEIDSEIVKYSRVYLDDSEACLKESGDLLNVFDDKTNQNEIVIGEIGEFLLNKIEGRKSADETTIFKSVGNAIQDFVIADRIYDKSLTENFGQEIRLYE